MLPQHTNFKIKLCNGLFKERKVKYKAHNGVDI